MKPTKKIIHVVWLAALSVFFQGSVGAMEVNPRIFNGSQTQGNAETGTLLIDPLPNDTVAEYQGICSGAMVGCQTFMTAAHCVCSNLPDPINSGNTTSNSCIKRQPQNLRVFLQNGGIYPVTSVAVDSSLDISGNKWQGDIAVLTLAKPLLGIPPTKINTTGDPSFSPDNPFATILGFGLGSDPETKLLVGDFGIKRAGSVKIKDCKTPGTLGNPAPFPLFLDNSINICWQFDPEMSDTCAGDSGGPLFIDSSLLGGSGGKVIAGVASGGISDSCQSGDVSWDANVFFSKNFIQTNTVGVLSSQGVCRKAVRNYAKKYLTRVYNAKRKCQDAVNKGKISTDADKAECDAKAGDKITKAQNAINLKSIASNCPGDVLEKSGLACSITAGADPEVQQQELKQCIIDAGDDAAERMLDVEYADYNPVPPGPDIIADKALLKCQKAIATASKNFMFGNLNAGNSCQLRKDSNKLVNSSDCPDATATKKFNSLTSSAEKKFLKSCTQDMIAALDAQSFGVCAGKHTVAEFTDCQLNEHATEADNLVNLALAQSNSEFTPLSCGAISQVGDTNTKISNQDNNTLGVVKGAGTYEHTFSLKAGMSVLRVTLNGDVDGGKNEIDLYVRFGATPDLSVSPAVANAFSTNKGTFEAVEISNPSPRTGPDGTWHVLVVEKGLSTGKPYQLTATALLKP